MAPKRSSSYQASSFPATILAHLAAVALITLVLVWLLQFRGGLAFRSHDKNKIFNVHPLLMVLGFILISGEAIMAYKTLSITRERQKTFHLSLQLIALLAGIIGVYAVFKYHKESGILDLYTLHSWLGITTISLFGLQWVLSFFWFWYPGRARAWAAPWHVAFGIGIFFMAILSAETGLIEKFIFLGLRRNQEALILNFTGILILVFALSVGFTVLLQ